jgi:hypothetical protein
MVSHRRQVGRATTIRVGGSDFYHALGTIVWSYLPLRREREGVLERWSYRSFCRLSWLAGVGWSLVAEIVSGRESTSK